MLHLFPDFPISFLSHLSPFLSPHYPILLPFPFSTHPISFLSPPLTLPFPFYPPPFPFNCEPPVSCISSPLPFSHFFSPFPLNICPLPYFFPSIFSPYLFLPIPSLSSVFASPSPSLTLCPSTFCPHLSLLCPFPCPLSPAFRSPSLSSRLLAPTLISFSLLSLPCSFLPLSSIPQTFGVPNSPILGFWCTVFGPQFTRLMSPTVH